MPGGARRFRNVHKHGSKKKHLRKEVPQTSATATTNEAVATPDSDVVEASAEARQDRNGLDPDPSSGDADRVQADEKAASSSSARSSDRDGNVRDSNAHPLATEYLIVDLDAINRLLAKTVCQTCSGNSLSVVRGERGSGIAPKLCLVCSNCGVMKISK